MATQEALVYPLLNEPSPRPHLNFGNAKKKKKRKLLWSKLVAVCFTLLLCWQLTATGLYLARCFTCFKEKSSTLLCDRNSAFPYSEEFELIWLVTQSFIVVILIFALKNVPAFLGYKAIFRHLKFLPSFWTFILLLVIAVSRYVMLSVMLLKSLVALLLIIGFALSYILTVIAAGVLNFTQLNFLKRQYPTYVFVLSKLTLLVIFVVNFTNFVISIFAVTLQVHDVHDALRLENSSDFDVIYDFLRNFGVTSFRYKMMSFFWCKMFIDDKSIL